MWASTLSDWTPPLPTFSGRGQCFFKFVILLLLSKGPRHWVRSGCKSVETDNLSWNTNHASVTLTAGTRRAGSMGTHVIKTISLPSCHYSLNSFLYWLRAHQSVHSGLSRNSTRKAHSVQLIAVLQHRQSWCLLTSLLHNLPPFKWSQKHHRIHLRKPIWKLGGTTSLLRRKQRGMARERVWRPIILEPPFL